MSSDNVLVECGVIRTPRVMQLEGMFDLPPSDRSTRQWSVALDLPEEWNIGLIVGPSGSGKTTIAKRLFGDRIVHSFGWHNDKSILDDFPSAMGIREITELLSSVGFSSPPSWVRPFSALSNGEQFRVTLARALAEMPDLFVLDEFTSVVDRTVARIGSSALAKVVRRREARCILLSCHDDIIEWLSPDWIYEPHAGVLSAGRSLRRPRIDLEIRACTVDAWKLFRHHHYLSGDLSCCAVPFLATWGGRPVAFCVVVHFTHPRSPGWREHRLVVLPDYQGLGVGGALSDYVASLFAATGAPYRSTTSHPALIAYRTRSPRWQLIRKPSLLSGGGSNLMSRTASTQRATASFKYVGPARHDDADGFGLRRYPGKRAAFLAPRRRLA